MRRISLKSITLLSILFSAAEGFGQTGDLGPQSVNVTTEYNPVITEAHKMMDYPVMDDSIPPAPKLTYGITSRQVPVDFQVEPIPAATMKGEPLVKLYNHHAKAGLGNYNTPYVEYWYNTLRSKKMVVAANAGHLSSSAEIRDYGKAFTGHNHASAFGKFFLPSETIDATLSYRRDAIGQYGYNNLYDFSAVPDVSLRKVYSLGEVKANLFSTLKDSSRLNHQVKLDYFYFADNVNAQENFVHVNGGLSKFVNTELFGGDINFTYFENKLVDSTGKGFILTFNPYVAMRKPKMVARLGAIVGIESDSASATYFYPDVNFEYRVVEEVLTAYADLTGGPTRNTYRSLANENPFLSGFSNLQNTRERFGIRAGIKGSITSDVTYNASAKYRKVENEYFYTFFESDLLQNSFNVTYDNAHEWIIKGDLGYRAGDKVLLNVKGEYISYRLENEVRPWHRPNWTTGVSAKYNIESKIILSADLFFVGSRFAKVYDLDGTNLLVAAERKLKGYADLNLGAEYRYTKRLGMFLNLNNIAGSRYFKYVNYPVYRLNLLAGISYSF